jgi:hypothetical protein
VFSLNSKYYFFEVIISHQQNIFAPIYPFYRLIEKIIMAGIANRQAGDTKSEKHS